MSAGTLRRALPLLPLLLVAAAAARSRPCPGPCLCSDSSGLVDCGARGLDRVPAGVPRDAWLLDLRGNAVREVRAGAFVGLWSLKVLLASNNSVHALHPQVREQQPREGFITHLDPYDQCCHSYFKKVF